MQIIKKSKSIIYNLIKHYRINIVNKKLDRRSKNLLDVGCGDLLFYNKIKEKYDVTLVDISPSNQLIKEGNIQKLGCADNSYDVVTCQEVLEHVPNPVKAILELKRITKRQLIITVPNEPFFTLFRFFQWDKSHLWAITPKLLKHYLGEPSFEKKIFLKRYYLGVWEFNII